MDTNVPQNSGGGGKKGVWVVVIIIALALIVWLVMPKKKASNQTESNNQNASEQTTASTASSEQSMRDLLAAGRPQKCTVSMVLDEQTQNKTEGTIYLASGKMRGDYSSTVNGQTMLSHYMLDGETMYSWTDEPRQGFMMKLSSQTSQSTQDNNKPSVDLDKRLNYHCSDWSVDNSLFNRPGDITFTDMSAMMQSNTMMNASSSGNSAGTSASVKAQQCAACDGLAGDQKAQCKAALACQ